MSAVLLPLAALAIILALFVALGKSRRKPPIAGPVPWSGTTLGEDEMQRRREELRDALALTPLGEELPRKVWRRLMSVEIGTGLVHEFHRDFCGHGLIRTENGVKLCDIQDGGHNTGDAIADWPDEQSFIAFFARQTDFSMSGWDENEPVFHSTDSWYCNNQRLTRKILARYARGQ